MAPVPVAHLGGLPHDGEGEDAGAAQQGQVGVGAPAAARPSAPGGA